jgi:hypothetical protein
VLRNRDVALWLLRWTGVALVALVALEAFAALMRLKHLKHLKHLKQLEAFEAFETLEAFTFETCEAPEDHILDHILDQLGTGVVSDRFDCLRAHFISNSSSWRRRGRLTQTTATVSRRWWRVAHVAFYSKPSNDCFS